MSIQSKLLGKLRHRLEQVERMQRELLDNPAIGDRPLVARGLGA